MLLCKLRYINLYYKSRESLDFNSDPQNLKYSLIQQFFTEDLLYTRHCYCLTEQLLLKCQ